MNDVEPLKLFDMVATRPPPDEKNWVVVVTHIMNGKKRPVRNSVYGPYTNHMAQKIARRIRDSIKYDDSIEAGEHVGKHGVYEKKSNISYAQAQQLITEEF